MIRKKLAPPVALPVTGLRRKLGVARSLVGHVIFECPRCKKDAVMVPSAAGYHVKCSACPHALKPEPDEHRAATTWNVTP